MYNLKIVKINPDGDGVTYLFVDGVYHLGGDQYHDKIDDQIEGIKTFLEKQDLKHYIEDIRIESKEYWPVNDEMMFIVPESEEPFDEFFERANKQLELYEGIFERDGSLNALYEQEENESLNEEATDAKDNTELDDDDEESIDDYIPTNY